MSKYAISVVFGLIIIAFLVLILNPFVIITAGERGIVLNWGAVSDKVLDEGLNVIMPVMQKVVKIDVKIQKEETLATAASKDLQTVSTTLALNYHIDAKNVNALWQKIGKDYKMRIIDPAIQEAMKAITAKYTAEELITKRQLVKDEVKQILNARLLKEFILVDELSIVNFEFSPSFNQAIEAKVTAEQSALAAKNKLSQVKFEAEQRVATAQAEATAIKIQVEAITQQGGENYVNLKAIEKWDGHLPTQMIPNGALPFLKLTDVTQVSK